MMSDAIRLLLPTLLQAMVTDLIVVGPSTTLLEAIAQMVSSPTDRPDGAIPPVAAAGYVWVVEDNQILGVLTERDVVHLSTRPAMLNHLQLTQVISRPGAILPKSALSEYETTAHLFQQPTLSPMAIVNDTGDLVGMITRESIWEAIARAGNLGQSLAPASSTLAGWRPQGAAARRQKNAEGVLEKIVDGILAGYWDWDVINNTEYYSPGFKHMFGYTNEELPNHPDTWQQLIFPEDLPKVLSCFQRHVESQGEIPFENEVRYHHKDGSTVWVLCSGQVIEQDDQGQPQRVIGCHVDITQRKQAELALQKSKEELENFFLVSLDLLCIADLEGNFRRVNRAWKAVLGYEPTELEGQSFLDLIHPDDVASTLAAIATLSQQEAVETFVNRYRCKGGSYRYIEWFSRPHGDLVYAAAHDITDQRLTEIELRKSTAHFQAAQRIAGLGSWEFEVNTGKIAWSDEVFEIFGRDTSSGPPSYEELLNLYHPDDQRYHDQVVQQALQSGESYDLECRAFRPDGSLVYVQARGEPIFDDSGKLLHLVGTVLNITDRKLWESKLLQATAQLKASNNELEAFAYSVSHDLRSPLRAIDGFSKALLEDYGDRIDAEGQDYFARIRHNVNRMGLLIDDLLRLSRISRSEMAFAVIDLSALVQEKIAELQTEEPHREVKAIVEPDLTTWADTTLMRVVIDNLLRNAWKFTSHHSKTCIEFGHTQVNGQPTYFIRDDGAGFDMAFADMLFGVFQRLHDTHEFPGTGIGLATVQRAIHRHGGTVWAEGAVEQGATIYFTLPPGP